MSEDAKRRQMAAGFVLTAVNLPLVEIEEKRRFFEPTCGNLSGTGGFLP
jgi:hypothetical protein